MGVLLGGAAVYLGRQDAPAPAPVVSAEPPSVDPATPPSPQPSRPIPTLADAVASTMDSVVNLESSRGLGAGVIVDPSGIVLTNHHVIAEALRPPPTIFGATLGEQPVLSARFANDRKVGASVLVADPGEDLAIVRLIPPSGEEPVFEAATIGRSSALVVGEEVFAIGNPLGLRNTVSRGIVSALDRTGIMSNEQRALIQLDASINVGNSGGPLFNLRGELVGIVTARGQRAQGIAFALPMDHVRGFLEALQDPTRAGSGVIGLSLDLDAKLPAGASALGYQAGLVVDEPREGGPADKGGLRKGDVIVALRGKRLDGLADFGRPLKLAKHLQKTVRGMFEGESLPVTVVRDEELLELALEIVAASAEDQVLIDAEELLGLVLEPKTERPTVERVVQGTQLSRYPSVLVGARIESVMGTAVETMDDLSARLQELRRLAAQRGSAPTVLVGFVSAQGESGRVLIAVR